MSAEILAFPSLQGARERGREKFGIDIEASFRSFISSITGLDPDGAEMDGVVSDGVKNKLTALGRHEVNLSSRQLEGLFVYAQTFDREKTAKILCLSLDTVKTHLKEAVVRLGANSSAQAVLFAVVTGLFDDLCEEVAA